MINEIFLEITNHCNFNCEFCPNSIMRRKRGFMTKELFQKIVREIAQNKLVNYLSLHLMGEPVLHPKFNEFLKYTAEQGQKIHLISNISLIKPDKLKDILKYVDVLELSLQSYSAKSFQQRHAEKMNYADYLKIVKNIIQTKFEQKSKTLIKISIIENSLNIIKNFSRKIDIIDSPAKFERFLTQYWYKFFQDISKQYKVKFSPPKKIRLNGFMQEFLPGVQMTTRWATTWGNTLTDKNKVIPAWRAKCDGLSQQLGILWDGRVVPCCGDFDGNVVVGDLQKNSLLEIMQSSGYQKMLKGFQCGKLIHPYCRKCKGGTTFLSWLASQAYSFIKFRNI